MALLNDSTVRAFIWSAATGMRDLGSLPGAFATVPPCCHTINDRGDIVGFSVDENGPRAIVWKKGVLMDLNTLIPADSPWYLLAAQSINDAGEIAGFGVNVETGQVHAFIASPAVGVGKPARGAAKPPVLPLDVAAAVRRLLPGAAR